MEMPECLVEEIIYLSFIFKLFQNFWFLKVLHVPLETICMECQSLASGENITKTYLYNFDPP